MNRSTLSQSTMPEVSLSAMRESKEQIREAYNYLAGTKYLVLQNICGTIYFKIAGTEGTEGTLFTAEKSISKVKALLENTAPIETYNAQIHRKQEQLESAPPEEQQEIQDKIDSYRELGDKVINEEIIKEIKGKSELLETQATEIESFDFKSQVEGEIERLNKELKEKINPEIERYTVLRDETRDQHDAISYTMNLMEENDLKEYYSDLIPSAEDLIGLMEHGNPELDLIMYGLEVYAALFDVVGDGFSYLKLVQARDYLYDQLEEYNQAITGLEDRQSEINKNLQDLDYIDDVESTRFVFTEQVRNLAQAYAICTEDIQSLMASDVNYDNVLLRMAEMVTYLENLQAS